MEWHENKKGKKSKIFPISQCSVGHFFQALLNVLNKSEFPQQNPESNHLFENIQSLKDLHFGCHFIKVFLKVLENRLTSHLIKKKSRRKFRVISLNFFFRSYTSFKKMNVTSHYNSVLQVVNILIQKTFLIVRIFLFP